VADDAVGGDLPLRGEDGGAVALRVVGVVVLDDVVVVAPVDIVDAAIDARRVGQEAFREAHGTGAAAPGPDAVGGADGLDRLEAGEPGGGFLDEAVLDLEEDDAVAVNVVHDGVADSDVASAVVAGAAADDDAGPLRGIEGGDAVNNDVLESEGGGSQHRHQTGGLGLDGAGHVVHHQIAEAKVAETAAGAGDQHGVGISAGGFEVLNLPVVLVRELEGGLGGAGLDDGQRAAAIGAQADGLSFLAGASGPERARAARAAANKDRVAGGKGGGGKLDKGAPRLSWREARGGVRAGGAIQVEGTSGQEGPAEQDEGEDGGSHRTRAG